MDSVWFCCEGIPGLAAGLDNCFGVVEHAEGKEALAQIEPDPLDRVEFRTVGWQRHQREVVRNGECAFVVPTGAVEDHGGVDVVWPGSGEAGEEQVHDLGVDGGQYESKVLAGGRTDGGEDVGPLVADLTRARGALASEPPAVTDPALVADAGLVLEPEFEALVGVGFGDRLQGRAEPLFLKRSCASASLCGCAGRTFCREKPSRRSTRVRLEGW